MQPTSSSVKSPTAIKKLLLFMLGIVFAAAAAFIANSLLRVKTIRLEGVAKGQTIYGLDNAFDASMILLRSRNLGDLIKQNNPTVSSVAIIKQYPDTLHLKISFYKPAVYLAADNGYLLLSEDGRVLERVKDGQLRSVPIIHYYEKISFASTQPGSYLSMEDILKAINFAEKVKAAGYQVITIDIDGVDMIGLNLEGKVIDFSSEKDSALQVYQMEQIVHQFRIEGKNFKKMDLRFNQPVLELKQ